MNIIKSSVLVVMSLPIVLGTILAISPSSPCACITEEMLADRLFMINTAKYSSSELYSQLIKNIPIGSTLENVKSRLIPINGKNCNNTDKPKVINCKFLLKSNFLSNHKINVVFTFNKVNALEKVNVSKT